MYNLSSCSGLIRILTHDLCDTSVHIFLCSSNSDLLHTSIYTCIRLWLYLCHQPSVGLIVHLITWRSVLGTKQVPVIGIYKHWISTGASCIPWYSTWWKWIVSILSMLFSRSDSVYSMSSVAILLKHGYNTKRFHFYTNWFKLLNTALLFPD